MADKRVGDVVTEEDKRNRRKYGGAVVGTRKQNNNRSNSSQACNCLPRSLLDVQWTLLHALLECSSSQRKKSACSDHQQMVERKVGRALLSDRQVASIGPSSKIDRALALAIQHLETALIAVRAAASA